MMLLPLVLRLPSMKDQSIRRRELHPDCVAGVLPERTSNEGLSDATSRERSMEL